MLQAFQTPFKISVSCTLRLSRSKKWDEKLSKTCKKPVCFTEFPVCPEMWQQHFTTNWIWPEMLQQQFRTNWVWLLFLESSHRLALFAFVQFHVVFQVWLESERFVTFTAVVFTSACHPRSQGWLWSINFWAAFSIPTPATTPRASTLNCSEYSPFACFLALCSSRLVWSENFFLHTIQAVFILQTEVNFLVKSQLPWFWESLTANIKYKKTPIQWHNWII